jgi:hypothetical protein
MGGKGGQQGKNEKQAEASTDAQATRLKTAQWRQAASQDFA